MFSIGHWRPEIGDPSFLGWFTVFSYYVCAGLSLAVVMKGRRMDRTLRRFRLIITVVVLVLGISKHVNLPGAITEIGRLVVYQMGGYEVRRWIQFVMVLLFTLGLLLLIRATRKAFPVVREHGTPETICLCYLSALAILRAISLHQAGAMLSADVFGVRLNWIVELAGVYALVVVLLVRILEKTSRGKERRPA